MTMGSNRTQRIVVSGNQWESAYRFRGPLLQDLHDLGLEVHVIGPECQDEYRRRLDALGLSTHGVPFMRAGLNPLSESRTLLGMYRVYRNVKPNIVLNYFAKPIIYGSLAATLAGVVERYSLVAGLGYVFSTDNASRGIRRSLLECTVQGLYRLALRRNQRVFFQNPDDLEEFVGRGLARRDAAIRVNGSGVDLQYYNGSEPPTEPVTFVLAARLIEEKGIRDLVEAVARLGDKGWGARCIVLGGLDDNPSAIPRAQVDKWVAEGLIEWPGQVDDIRPWLEKASVYVLPSYYREGIPRSIQEAMAMGRAVITTDTPGCRETVEPGRNGFLVSPRDVNGLVAAMERYLQDPGLIGRHGRESRRLAEARFDVHRINATMLENMGLAARPIST